MGHSNGHRRTHSFAMALLLLSGIANAADLQHEIDVCAAIADNDSRLACFDKLASAGQSDTLPAAAELAAEETIAAKPASEETVAAKAADEGPAHASATTTAATAASGSADTEAQSPPIIPPHQSGDDRENPVFNVRLIRCAQTSTSGRQVYYFDNGEVWRQSNSSRKKVRNCDTAVTVELDVFGYKMRVPSENRSIRISPVR